MKKKKRILIPVALPPLVVGGEKMMKLLLSSQKINNEFNIKHIDISNHRGNWNRQRLDSVNIYTALKSSFLTWIETTKFSPDLIYFSIARDKTGIIRDYSLMLLPILLRRKIIVHLHDSYFYEFCKKAPYIIRAIIDSMIPRFNGAIVHSQRLKYNFSGWIGKKRIVCVPNGIPDFVRMFHAKKCFHLLFYCI